MRFEKLIIKQMSFVFRAAPENHVKINSRKCPYTSIRRHRGSKCRKFNYGTLKLKKKSLKISGPSFNLLTGHDVHLHTDVCATSVGMT